MIRSMLRFAAWLDNHWIGDALGVVCLFGLLGISLFFAGVYQ